MLRMIFVILIVLGGAYFAAQSAFYGLLLYLWNAYFRPDDWTYGGFIASLRLSWIIGAYVVLRTLASFPNPKINARTVLIWMFFAQATIGTLTSEHPDWSSNFLEDFGKVLLIAYLIVVLINDRREFRLVLLVIAMSLGFETAKQGWANLWFTPGAKNDNTIVFLGDNNGVALGTMMLVPILGALAQTSRLWQERYIHRFVAVGVFLRGISTYSRGGFLGAAALSAIMVVRAEKKIRAIISIAAVALLVWSIMPQTFWDRMDTIQVENEEERDDSSAGRLYFWQVGQEMARVKPLTGVGLNGYNKSYQDYDYVHRYEGERAAHSVWFGVLGDLGYPGLILFVANIVMAFWSCWSVVRLARGRPALRDLKLFANALTSTLVVYSVTGSFLSLQYSEMAWHIFGLSTALHLVAIQESQNIAETAITQQVA
jgi:putative inorganic carbon (HCO3(-)) transporter